MMRPVILTMVFACSLASSGQAGSLTSSTRGAPAIVVRVPLLSFAWLASRARDRFGHGREVENASPLRRDQGWTVLALPVSEPVNALFLEVTGRVQFDSAEIIFRDGPPRPLDLRGVVRGRGLFELHDCGRIREVTEVRLNVRAATDQARVGLRIARFDAFPGNG